MTRWRSPAILALALVLTGLGGRFAVHMLQLARKGNHQDFAALYTAAYVYRSGYNFYDPQPNQEHFGSTENPVLRETARRVGTLHIHDGLAHVHVFSYPPFTVLIFVPFTALAFRPAAVLWQILSLGFFTAGFSCLWKSIPLSLTTGLTLTAVMLLFEPLENSLGLGQISSLILALICIFLGALRSDRPAVAGLSLGLAIALRLHPVLFLGYLLWRKKWRVLAWATGTALVCTFAAIPLVGWDATLTYATLVAPKYGRAWALLGNHSLSGLLINCGSVLIPSTSASLWRSLGFLLSLALLIGAFLAMGRPGRANQGRMVFEIAWLSTVLLLAVPNTTINHLVLLLIPLAVLLERVFGPAEEVGLLPWIAAAYLLIGAVDDYYMHPSLTRGPAVLATGIKTYGIMVLAGLGLRALRQPNQRVTF